jgi:hypothetical protein
MQKGQELNNSAKKQKIEEQCSIKGSIAKEQHNARRSKAEE